MEMSRTPAETPGWEDPFWKELEWPIDFSDGLPLIAWVEVEEGDDGLFYARSADVKNFVAIGSALDELLNKVIPDCMPIPFLNAEQRVTVKRAKREANMPLYPYLVIPGNPVDLIDDETKSILEEIRKGEAEAKAQQMIRHV